MKVLVIGSGGREHALVWKIRQSYQVTELFCAPGNGGIEGVADCVPIAVDDFESLADFAIEKSIDVTIVGPEKPLTDGIVDYFQEKGLRIFGPTKRAARIEGSKAYAKSLMKKYGIPTADFMTFTGADEAFKYLETHPAPIVVKASGLAAGKGSLVCRTDEEARKAVDMILKKRVFGSAGDAIVIEECLQGEELSIFALTDGNDFLMLPPSQDHKPALDGDRGPNTGGMGAYAPAPLAAERLLAEISGTIIKPTIDALRSEGSPYKGLLYAGLMITDSGPKVIEFNCRFGDPETQVVLPLIKNDLTGLIDATIDGTIGKNTIEETMHYAVCVIMASGGYPGSYEKGKEIYGFENLQLNRRKFVFHSGTKLHNGKLYTNGGRVLGMTALHFELDEAIENAYQMVECIHFDKEYYRTDIGKKGLKHLNA